MKILLKIILVTAAIFLLPWFIPGIHVSGVYFALIAAVVLGLVNVLIKPLLKLVTLPINILTLGLFGVVINVLLFWLVATFVPGFSIDTFMAALLGSLVIATVNWAASHL